MTTLPVPELTHGKLIVLSRHLDRSRERRDMGPPISLGELIWRHIKRHVQNLLRGAHKAIWGLSPYTRFDFISRLVCCASSTSVPTGSVPHADSTSSSRASDLSSRRFAAGLTAFLAGRPRRAAGFGAGAGAAADAAAALVRLWCALGGLRAALAAAIRPLIVLPSIAVSAKAALSLGHHSIPATVVGHSSAWLREMGGTFHIPESAPEQSATSGHTHSDQRRRALDLEGSRIAQSSFRDT